MKKWLTKKRIIIGLITGFGFAAIMAGFDYYGDKPFNLLKFLFHLFFFGLFQSIIIYPLAEKK